MRLSEVLGLKWVDVDLDAATLRVERGLQRVDGKLELLPTKTARSQRTIPLPEIMVSTLRKHHASQGAERLRMGAKWQEQEFVFTTPIGTPIDPRNCTRLVQAACKKAEVRVVRLHDFRHGAYPFCSPSVSRLARRWRSSVTTLNITMNIYGHVSLDNKRAALDKLGDLFGETGEGSK